ncbi:MAG: baseplate J/gp47 family protein [Anaerolineales bacterium]|nr:baseplate J/gp47 family protein [Anaerolineales bacterium]
MKTQVVHLELHDDVVSVRDKMSWAKTARILLVWPPRRRILERTLDLLLLQRHAAGLGAQLGLVTRSAEIRHAAGELGIPFFKNIAEAQNKPWRKRTSHPKPTRRNPRPDPFERRAEASPPGPAWQANVATRLTFFTLGVLAVLAVVLLFIPSATVSLYPKLQTQELTLQVGASQSATSVNMAGSLPAHEILIVVEGSQFAQATGQASVPDKPAQGVVRFRNLTTTVVGIPAGTVIRTMTEPAVRFVTMQDGVAEGGVGKTIDIPVRAVDPGLAGNLAADTLVAIQGDLGTELAVANPEPTSGGTERTVAMPTADERARLRAVLLADLRQQALDQFTQNLSPGDLPFPDTIMTSQTLNETYQPEEGQPGETLTLTMQVEISIEYVQASDLNMLAATALDAGLTNEMLPVADTMNIVITNKPASRAGGVTNFEIHASRTLKPNINLSSTTRALQGLSPIEAGQRLESMLPLDSPPQIQLVPSWWPWLPFLQFRITINV